MIEKPNIIFITIDALRGDHLGFMGYGKNISPNIDALAKESTVFSHAYATGPLTPYSFPAILTSTYPFDYQGFRKIEKPRKLISEVLQEHGYTTAAFHGNPFLSNFFGYNKGWDYFEYLTPAANPPLGPTLVRRGIRVAFNKFLRSLSGMVFNFFPEGIFRLKYLFYRLGMFRIVNQVNGASVNVIVKEFIRSVKDGPPFFIWIHYMDVHDPYLPYDYYSQPRTLSYREMIGKGAPQSIIGKNYTYSKSMQRVLKKHVATMLDLYDQGIRYVDDQLGDLFDFLHKEDVWQNSIICLTSDHGDEFLEHGGASHFPKLYNELLHVPLLIRAPEIEHQVIEKKVSLIDVSPTLLELAGFEKPSCFKGENIFGGSKKLIFHQAVDSFRHDSSALKLACQSDSWKYIVDYGSSREELYDLVEDSGETRNLAEEQPKVLSEMRAHIKTFLKEHPPKIV